MNIAAIIGNNYHVSTDQHTLIAIMSALCKNNFIFEI